jgi:hypothetical protein
VPDIFRKYISPNIWASNIPALPGINCVGRFEIYFKMARKDCLTGRYLLVPDHIKICFSSNERRFPESWQFDRVLEAAMIKPRQILLQQ